MQLAPDADVDEAAVVEWVKGRLSGFKAPRRVRFVETIGRSPSGKVDYARHRSEATDWLGIDAG